MRAAEYAAVCRLLNPSILMPQSQRKSYQTSACIIRYVKNIVYILCKHIITHYIPEKQAPKGQLGILSELLYAQKYHYINP